MKRKLIIRIQLIHLLKIKIILWYMAMKIFVKVRRKTLEVWFLFRNYEESLIDLIYIFFMILRDLYHLWFIDYINFIIICRHNKICLRNIFVNLKNNSHKKHYQKLYHKKYLKQHWKILLYLVLNIRKLILI